MAINKHRYKNEFYISDLRVQIYVIGYKCYGESTVLLIMNGDEVNYSIVIDSYHYKPYKGSPTINKAVDILRDNHVNHLDVLCWTHPHDDHSKGITTLLNKFCDEDTMVLYPLYVENNSSDVVQLKQVSKNTIEEILSINKSGKVQACPIGVMKERSNNVDKFRIVNPYDEEDVRTVNIDVITPISYYITKYVNEKKCNDPNELSITLILDIDNYGFYFGGDTTNAHIESSNKEMLEKCRFIKIPHHASDTADHLPNYLHKDKIDAICTTVFVWGKTNDPNSKVIKQYQSFFKDIYSTNKHLKTTNYGIILYEYDFSRGYPSCEISIEGNVGKMELVE